MVPSYFLDCLTLTATSPFKMMLTRQQGVKQQKAGNFNLSFLTGGQAKGLTLQGCSGGSGGF